jgi:hypothetical protein
VRGQAFPGGRGRDRPRRRAEDRRRGGDHPKEGVFEGTVGNKLAFSGSSNDSINGGQWNYEVFSVYATWPLTVGAEALPPLTAYLAPVEKRFERLWNGDEESWIALDIPDAARPAGERARTTT